MPSETREQWGIIRPDGKLGIMSMQNSKEDAEVCLELLSSLKDVTGYRIVPMKVTYEWEVESETT